MKILVLAALAASVLGCGLIQALEGGGGTGGSTATGAGGVSATPGGVDCGTDPETSAVLCLGNTLCPGLMIDQEVYPGCGFRVAGATIDIECSCNGFLCPLAASSCADATAKLMADNYGVVCSQLSGGTCVQGTPVATTTAASSAGGGSSTCDTTCRSECGGEPSCLQLCGC